MLGRPVLVLLSVWLVFANGDIADFSDAGTKKYSDYVSKVLDSGLTKFTLNLDKAIDRLNDGMPNTIFSPLNLMNTLAIIHLSANGETFYEITNAFDLVNKLFMSQRSELVYQVFGRLLDDVYAREEHSSKPVITGHSAVFNEISRPIQQEFEAAIMKLFHVKVFKWDMINFPIRFTNRIEIWHKINIPLISKKVQAIVASTLNFVGKRYITESREITREIFRTAENKNVSVDMAHTTCIGRYYRDEELNVEFIELPYHPNPVVDHNYIPRTSMYILKTLSKNPGDLKRVKRFLIPERIERFLGELIEMKIDLTMPIMKLSSTLNLKQQLTSLGLYLFDENSNLNVLSERFHHWSDTLNGEFVSSFYSNLLENVKLDNSFKSGLDEKRKKLSIGRKIRNPGIFSSHFLHETSLEFSANETIASSATVTINDRFDDESGSSDHPGRRKRFSMDRWDGSDHSHVNVLLDQPFLFFIKHFPTNLTLFWGTVNDPTSD